MTPITPDQLSILQHSLGCDQYGQTSYQGRDEGDGCGIYHRKHFVAGPDSPDGITCLSLVAIGLMKDHGKQSLAAWDNLFTVTHDGIEAMRAQSPKKPKISRSKQRYQDFLNDDCGWKFGEWLKVRVKV